MRKGYQLTVFLGLAWVSLASLRAQDAPVPVTITVYPDRLGPAVPPRFTGFSYGVPTLTDPNLLGNNPVLERLVAQVGPGVVRIGGNATDNSGWSREPRTLATSRNVVTADDLNRLFGFARATGSSVLLGLSLPSSSPAMAADEAQYATAAAGSVPLELEVGNEPDAYSNPRVAHRPSSYTLDDFLAEWSAFVTAIRAVAPAARLSGPGSANNPDTWTAPFAARAAGQISSLTQHRYPLVPSASGSGTRAASIPNLLRPQVVNEFASQTTALGAAAQAAGVPLRWTEVNSVVEGGEDGVSNVFAAALWGADTMFAMAVSGAAGINFAGGGGIINAPVSWAQSQYRAQPLYYGMLLFRLGAGMSQGRFVSVARSTSRVNLSAYAVLRPEGTLAVTLINKDLTQPAEVTLQTGTDNRAAWLWRLTGSSASARDGITLAGASVDSDGTWRPTVAEPLAASAAGSFTLTLPALSAAVIDIGAPPLAIADAAAGRGTVTAGSLATAYGMGLQNTSALLVRDSTGEARPALLFAVTPTQVNFQIPPGTANGLAHVLVGRSSASILVASTAPALFTANSNGQGVPAALANRILANGQQSPLTVFECAAGAGTCQPVPIDVSGDAPVFLSLYGTGLGSNPSDVICTIGGTAVPVQFAGPQGGYAGLDQVNVQLPSSLRGRGEVSLVLTVQGRRANPVTLRF